MSFRPSIQAFFGALLLVLTLACGGGGGGGGNSPTPVAISVTPTTASLFTGASQTFAATVTGNTNTAVTWTVQEGAPGGTVTSGGVYTAPATPGTYHVIATSVADTSKRASATVTVTAAPVVAVALTPTTTSLFTGASQTFTATVTGNANTAVTWTVQEGALGGTITSGGVYTAPATPGTYHVIATSVADPSKVASATVTVTAAPVVAVALTPTTTSLFTGASQTFTATVTGNANTAVTWTVQEGALGGTITSGGVYTAPATPGTYHVIATSVADASKAASATLTVTAAPVVAVALMPTSASLVTGASQTFTATVTGNANTAVTWTVQEGALGGTITSGGVYTAPATPGTYHVIATSVADTSKSASATVTVTSVATGLNYVDPTTGTYRLLKNSTLSTASHLVLDVVGVGAPSGAAIAFTLSVGDSQTLWVKVDGADAEVIENGTVLSLGTGPLALKGKVVGGVLTAALGQKGTGSSVALNGVLARVALDLKAGAPLGPVPFAVVKAQVLQSDGSLPVVSISIGTLTVN
ncbi:Ig-like domain-containing protein [Geothrix mesophila]|uniref:Ig-like domain-containing protein n=1 Tax=Geothrix mesophila TaxID=2922723 RepID=UPI001FAD5F70|nr:hypothetical protein [Geothrix sp. SG198]